MEIFEFDHKNDFNFVNSITYKVVHKNKVFNLNWIHVSHTLGLCTVEKNVPLAHAKDWEEIYLWQMKPICQKELALLLGDDFPWSESSWIDKKAFEEWDNPSTLEGKVLKATDDNLYCIQFTKTAEWNNAILSSTLVEETSKNEPWWKEEYLLETKFGFFEYVCGMDHGSRWAKLKSLNDIDVTYKKARIARYNAKKERIAAMTSEQRLAYSQKAGRIARSYGISFSVVLHSFKGNEDDVKRFVQTLTAAFNKPFNDHELCCGRERRRSEIQRLGIEIANADPNYIAPYILACLREKKLIK